MLYKEEFCFCLGIGCDFQVDSRKKSRDTAKSKTHARAGMVFQIFNSTF